MFQQLFKKNKNSTLEQLSVLLVLSILTTLALSLLNLNSVFIILLLFITLLKRSIVTSIKIASQEPFFLWCFLLFLVFVAGIFYADNWIEGASSAEKRLGLLVIPFIFCSRQFSKALQWTRIMFVFCFIFSAIALCCLLIAAVNFFYFQEIDSFFYHSLVKPISQNAIYVSIMGFIIVVYLFENKNFVYAKISIGYYFVLAFLIIFLVLLSSKLVLGFLVYYVIFKLFYSRSLAFKVYGFLYIILAIFCVVILTENPVKERFKDISTFDVQKFYSKDLSSAYFNGVEFRLYQWKLTFEILNDEKAWLIGVGPADAQRSLDNKFKKYRLYQGDPTKKDRGYLGYNVHNQYGQFLLQSGLVGLLCFLFVCYYLFELGRKNNIVELRFCILLLIAFCFTESVLQSQKGLVSFTLFPLLLYYGKRNET